MTDTITTAPTDHTLPLAGRRAVVTGAGTGIGAATARLLAARGADVSLLGRRADRITAVADEVGGVAIPADVSDPVALATAADRVHASGPDGGAGPGAANGTVDLVVANAGAMLAAPFAEADREEWRRMLDVNVMGLLDTARAFLPDLLAAASEGRPADLVLIGSLGARVVLPDYAVYTATKAAVSHLATTLRAELGPQQVRVHNVEPGMTESDLGHDMASAASRDSLASFREQYPPIPASAIAEAVAWAASLPFGVNAAELLVLPTAQG